MIRKQTKTQKHDGVISDPFKVEQLENGNVEYRNIQAFECCNSGGENAGWCPLTPEGDKWLIEKRFIPKDSREGIRFTNVWTAIA